MPVADFLMGFLTLPLPRSPRKDERGPPGALCKLITADDAGGRGGDRAPSLLREGRSCVAGNVRGQGPRGGRRVCSASPRDGLTVQVPVPALPGPPPDRRGDL